MGSTSQAQELDDAVPQPTETGPGFFEILVRRSWLMVLGGLAGLGLAYLYVVHVPPKFVSAAQLLVIKKRPDMVPGMERGGIAQEDYLSTQAGIIKSHLIVGRAARDGNLATLKIVEGARDVTASLLPALSVKRDLKDRTNAILDLSFKGLEPEDCKKVLDAVIRSYQTFLQEDYRKRSAETLDLIVGAKAMLEKDLTRKTAEYLAFRRKNPSVRRKGKVADNNIYNEMLLNLHAKRLTLRVRHAEIDALLLSIAKGWKRDGGHEQIIAMIYQLPSRAVSDSGGQTPQSSSLEDKLLPPLIEEQTLLAEYAPTHPLVVAAHKRVELAYKVVTSILQQDLAGVKTAEQSLADLYRAQELEAQKSVTAEVEDEVLRNDLARIQQLADETIKRLQEIDVVKALGGYDAEVVGPPRVGELAMQSNPVLIFPAAVLLGLLGGAGLAVVIPAARRKTFLRAASIRTRLGWPLLGHLPLVRPESKWTRQARTGGLAAILCTLHRPASPEAEAYRGLRTALFFTAGEEHQVIQVTAPEAGEGTSTLAANLAVSLAQAGKTTLLMDGNLRRPRLHALFGLAAEEGLASLLAGGGEPAEVIQPSGIGGLSLLPCGPIPPNPAELLSSPRFQALLAVLREQYDFVVIDTPPVLAVTDPAVVAARVDGTLVTLRGTRKELEQAERAKELLEGVHARVLGVVVTGLKGRAARHAPAYEGYPSV